MRSTRLVAAILAALAVLATVTGEANAQTQGFEQFRRDVGHALMGPTPERTTERTTERTPGRSAKTIASPMVSRFTSRNDSLSWQKAKDLADRSTGFRVLVSLVERRLWVVSESDTLLAADVAVAKGTTLSYAGTEKTFTTPRGMRRVLSKDTAPIWNPPDWLYVETAEEHGLKLAHIPTTGSITISGTGTSHDGEKLTVMNNRVQVLGEDGSATEFPVTLHIVYGETLYIPPLGTENRRIMGTLGKFKLDLGDGFMLHGTPDQGSIGLAATHGCVRLRDADIEWLFENVPVGTKVYIY